MREQQVFGEPPAAATDLDLERDPGQLRERPPGLGVEGQRHERRRRRNDAQAELVRDAVAEVGGADLRNRQAAGGDHHTARREPALPGHDLEEFTSPRDARDLARHGPAHTGFIALGAQHVDDSLRGLVAEQLPLVLFVKCDAAPPEQGDEIGRRVARQHRAAEVRVGRKEILGARVQVGEVAAPAA
jgi:hypothetical protein